MTQPLWLKCSWYAADCGSFLLSSWYVWSSSKVHWTARDVQRRSMMNHWRQPSLHLPGQQRRKHQLCRSASEEEDPIRNKGLESQELSWYQHKNQSEFYPVAVIPCLLYSIECTTLYPRHITAPTRLHLRDLCSILDIKWRDRIPDVDVRAVPTQSVLKP